LSRRRDRLIVGRHEVTAKSFPAFEASSLQSSNRCARRQESDRTLRDGSFSGWRFPGFQALCAGLRSCSPSSGAKYILRAGALIKLALIGFQPRESIPHGSALKVAQDQGAAPRTNQAFTQNRKMTITLSWCVLHFTYGALTGRVAGLVGSWG
jgi:hypothetical protein